MLELNRGPSAGGGGSGWLYRVGRVGPPPRFGNSEWLRLALIWAQG